MLTLFMTVKSTVPGSDQTVEVPWQSTFFPRPDTPMSDEANIRRAEDALIGPLQDIVTQLARAVDAAASAAARAKAEAEARDAAAALAKAAETAAANQSAPPETPDAQG